MYYTLFAISFASDIVTHHNRTKNLARNSYQVQLRNSNKSIDNTATISEHSLHLIKTSFNSRLTQNKLVFEQSQNEMKIKKQIGQHKEHVVSAMPIKQYSLDF